MVQDEVVTCSFFVCSANKYWEDINTNNISIQAKLPLFLFPKVALYVSHVKYVTICNICL